MIGIRNEGQKRFFILLLTLCLIVVSIGIVKADETIFIRADGTVEGTDKIQRTGNIYTFLGNISIDGSGNGIIVEKDNIVIDGIGYILQGTGQGSGIYLSGRSNLTITNVKITNFRYGIMLMSSNNNILADNNAYSNTWAGIQFGSSNNNTISGNNIASNSEDGIALYSSSFNIISGNNITSHNRDGVAFYSWSNNNTLSGNNITNNIIGRGVRLDISSFNTVSGNNITNNASGLFAWSSNHKIYHNNFINNTNHAGGFEPNAWDDGYPSGGNYWSDYTGVDGDDDGIGDTPYVINAENQDNYPFIDIIPEFPSWIILTLFLIATFSLSALRNKLEKI